MKRLIHAKRISLSSHKYFPPAASPPSSAAASFLTLRLRWIMATIRPELRGEPRGSSVKKQFEITYIQYNDQRDNSIKLHSIEIVSGIYSS